MDMSKLIDLNGVGAIRDWVTANFVLKSEVDQMMTSTIKITFGSNFEGQTYTITGGANETYTGTVPDTLIVEQSIKTLNTTYTISCDTTDGVSYEKTINIDSYYGIYPLQFLSFIAYLVCYSDPLAMITATGSSKVYTGTADTNGSTTLNIGVAGTYSVTATLNGATTTPVSVDVTADGESYECLLPSSLPAIAPWATGTDEEIATMIDSARAGTINLQTDGGWAVGDVRTIQVSAFTGGGNIVHAAQSIDIAISSFDDYMDCGAVMQFDFKDALARENRINSSYTNVGGYEASEMKTTTLPALVNALPEWLRSRLLEFSVLASAGNQSTAINTVTGNKLALRSEIEIFGTAAYSVVGEGSQIPYYTTVAKRIKKAGHNGSASQWWERSPYKSDENGFCFVNPSGNAYHGSPSTIQGVAPFGCV
jgi:hypothetical protein